MNGRIEQVEQIQPEIGEPDYWKKMLSLQGAGTDSFLQELVRVVNRTRVGICVTLMTSGGMVTGFLIDGKTFYEKFAEIYTESLGRGNPGLKVDEIKASVIAKGAIYDGVDGSSGPYQMIHIDKARFGSSAGFIPDGGVLWRGRISAVSGFSLGALVAVGT